MAAAPERQAGERAASQTPPRRLSAASPATGPNKQLARAASHSRPLANEAPSTPAEAPAEGDDQLAILDGAADVEPWLALPEVAARRARLGLSEPSVAAFADKCEFVSLGNFCGVARALQAAGLKRCSYPFDWVRSPLWGVQHCLETDFEDFLTFTTNRCDDEHNLKIFQASRWGGSFWHHDPSLPKVKADMVRRIERLLCINGNEASSTTPRVYVRAVNSSLEVEATLKLYELLSSLLPEAQTHLLMIMDFQLSTGPLRLEDNNSRVLFYRVHESIFAQAPWSMQRTAEAYTEGIAAAVKLWAAGPSSASWAAVPSVHGLEGLREAVDHFDGGSPASESFWPRRLQGQQICLRGAKHRLPGLLVPAPLLQKAVGASEVMQVRVPEGVAPGAMLHTEVFGRQLRFPVPEGASTGQLLQLRLAAGGMVTTALVVATAAATAATAATAAGQGFEMEQQALAKEAARPSPANLEELTEAAAAR